MLIRNIIVAILLPVIWVDVAHSAPLKGNLSGTAGNPTATGSQIGPNFMSSELPLLNVVKTSSTSWGDVSAGHSVPPDQLDATGMPIPGGNWTVGGAQTNLQLPGTFVMSPPHYVLTATGLGKFSVSLGTTGAACTGAIIGNSCNNAGCSTFTASVSGNILDVIKAPTGSGCSLVAGAPISGRGLSASKFGVPIFITGLAGSANCPTCTGTGGIGTYAINASLTIANETMTMGMRWEFTLASGTSAAALVNLQVTLAASQSGNPIQNFSFVPFVDEAAYWASNIPCGSGQACIIGTAFKSRMQQGGFSILRDLNWVAGNVSMCSTWATRVPINYFSYNSGEYRNAAAGTMTYVAGGQTYTIPNPGQYIDAVGDGASGGTISYTAGTDTYSITVNSGNFVDKQTFITLIPTTGTVNSLMSMNGNTAVPILNSVGSTLTAGLIPTSGRYLTFFYDEDIGGVLMVGGAPGLSKGIACGMPPEAVIEITAELNLIPWHVLPYFALDPMTDWTTQEASYLKSNYTPPSQSGLAGPIFEVTNEPFNCATASPSYLSAKSRAHIAADINHAWTGALFWCGSSGNNPNEEGKMSSTAAQDIIAVFGTAAEILAPVQTGGSPSTWGAAITSPAYVRQSMPAQTGYQLIPAYNNVTRVSLSNYYGAGYTGTSFEANLGYCYFNYSVSAGCQAIYVSQQAPIDVYMSGSLDATLTNNISQQARLWATWNASLKACASGTRPASCKLNATSPWMAYEGGWNISGQRSDATQVVMGATNDAAGAVLATSKPNGCVVGQVNELAFTGGTWSSANGSYAVTAVPSSTTCKYGSLNSSGLGTFASGTITYTGSANYLNYMRQASYLQPALYNITQTAYSEIIANGGANPSQFNLAGSFNPRGNGGWYITDPYNYLTPGVQLATCSSCTISSTTMTLGGTITGIFAVGMVVTGTQVHGNSIVTACTRNGAGPCGSNATDVLTLSQSSKISSGEVMNGYIPPNTISGGPGSISPIPAFKAICDWNHNSAMCQ